MLQTFEKFHRFLRDPHLHFKSYVGVSDSSRFQGVNQEWIRLSRFSYSLRDATKSWLKTLPLGTINSWNTLAEKFLISTFHPPEMSNS